MFWYYEMLQLHMLLAASSGVLFLLRGLGVLFGAAWPMDDRVRTIGGGIDFLITLVGLSLWGLLKLNPLYYPWLFSKFLLLALYILFANLTLRIGQSTEVRFVGFLLALASYGAIFLVSTTHDPWGGL